MIKFTITACSTTADIVVEHTKEWPGPRICPVWVDKFILYYDFVFRVKDNIYYYDHILFFKDQPTFDQFLPQWLNDNNEYRIYRKKWYKKNNTQIIKQYTESEIGKLIRDYTNELLTSWE